MVNRLQSPTETATSTSFPTSFKKSNSRLKLVISQLPHKNLDFQRKFCLPEIFRSTQAHAPVCNHPVEGSGREGHRFVKGPFNLVTLWGQLNGLENFHQITPIRNFPRRQAPSKFHFPLSLKVTTIYSRVGVSAHVEQKWKTNTQRGIPNPNVMPERSSDPIMNFVYSPPLEQVFHFVQPLPKLRRPPDSLSKKIAIRHIFGFK